MGRLDYMSSGLILYTNDGDFTKAVAHPSAQTEKEYIVETSKPIPEEILVQFAKGFVIEGVHVGGGKHLHSFGSCGCITQ